MGLSLISVVDPAERDEDFEGKLGKGHSVTVLPMQMA